MNKKRLIGYLFVMVSAGCIHAQEKKVSAQEYKLWYDRPAQVWTEALPLGNGIWNAGNRTNTTKRRNHLGRTPQQQRKPERTGVYSEGT